MKTLTYFLPMLHFYNVWKQKTLLWVKKSNTEEQMG